MKKFASSRVAVFGLGGVGGYIVEALARSGIGALDLIDNDKIGITNINRQIFATSKTVGRYKVDVAEERIYEISPECAVRTYKTFYLPKTCDQIDFGGYDYVVDAIDTVAGKIAIIEKSKKENVPVISSMGAGNKTDPTAFEIADLYETSVCPLAKAMRRECKKRGIYSLKVVYSREKPVKPHKNTSVQRAENTDDIYETKLKADKKKIIPGSTVFVTATAGFIIAGEVIKDLANMARTRNGL